MKAERGKCLLRQFQAIYNIRSGELFGYECLRREEDWTGLSLPERLERTIGSIRSAYMCFAKSGQMKDHCALCLNVSSSVLLRDAFQTFFFDWMNTHSVKPENLVLEINGIQEKEINPLKDAFEVWKNTGIRLTIDRFGIGYTTLQDVFELKPDFLKLDQKFVRGLRKSRFKKVALESLIHFSHKNGFELIVDGVRDLPTLFILMQMGVAYAQGDGISKPSSLAGNLGNWFDDIGE